MKDSDVKSDRYIRLLILNNFCEIEFYVGQCIYSNVLVFFSYLLVVSKD